jgi:hypothetical protein
VPLIIKLSLFIGHISEASHLVADDAIGVDQPLIPVVRKGGVERMAIDKDVVI